jgi:hypothetical protein
MKAKIDARVEAKLRELGLLVAQAMDDEHMSSEKGKSSISPQAISLHQTSRMSTKV